MYLESPAGVGYSVAGGARDKAFDDLSQSVDTYIALDAFYKKFPTFLKNELYISGESYAGIYVPYLAWQVHQHNEQAATDPSIQFMNLKGFLVGNGCTDWEVDTNPALPDTLAAFNIVPQQVVDRFNDIGCYFSYNGLFPSNVTDKNDTVLCDAMWYPMYARTLPLNIYDLYRSKYPPFDPNLPPINETEREYGEVLIGGEVKRYKKGRTISEYAPWLKSMTDTYGDYFIDNSAFLDDYVNSNETREALNIPPDVQPWEQCSTLISAEYTALAEGSYWIWAQLRGKYRMLKYSGDTDGAVPTIGTKRWIQKLQWPVTQKWRNWYTNGQLSGSVQSYDGLDFVTIHGAGHMCPQWHRQDTTTMILNWIHGEPF
jgi:carboxypeptidase C (cathepsin A)